MTKHLAHMAPALAVLLAANLIAGPPNWVAVERHPGINTRHRERIDAGRPGLVLLGNSILREGVDEEGLGRRLGVPCLTVARGGSASAWWYLALKNLIAASSHRVPAVAIVFRDHYLTEPGYRVTGKYKLAIDRIAGADEPALDRLAYLDGMDPATYLLGRLVPLYQRRQALRQHVELGIKDGLVARALGLEPGGVDAAIERVFATGRLDPLGLGAMQAASEAVSDRDSYDFAARVPRSFLPEMIRVAREAGMRLVFVRAPRRRDLDPAAAPAALGAYVEALGSYLAERDIPLVDLSGAAALGLAVEDFADGDHLGPSGRALLTEALAEALGPLR